MEGKARKEMVFARVQAGEADAGDGDEAGLLRKHLDVAERFEQRHVLARGRENPRRGTRTERLQREPAARVPEVAADQARAAFRAVPQGVFRHRCHAITL